MAYILEKAGHTVQTARNGKEAVTLMDEQTARVDVILMDIEMPEMDGRAATAAIRALEASQHRAPTPIIALTAHNDLNAQQEFLASGFNAILTKPINPADIHATLARLVT